MSLGPWIFFVVPLLFLSGGYALLMHAHIKLRKSLLGKKHVFLKNVMVKHAQLPHENPTHGKGILYADIILYNNNIYVAYMKRFLRGRIACPSSIIRFKNEADNSPSLPGISLTFNLAETIFYKDRVDLIIHPTNKSKIPGNGYDQKTALFKDGIGDIFSENIPDTHWNNKD